MIFFIYLYQRYVYSVDPKRVNEFGTSQEMLEKHKEGESGANGSLAVDGGPTEDENGALAVDGGSTEEGGEHEDTQTEKKTNEEKKND